MLCALIEKGAEGEQNIKTPFLVCLFDHSNIIAMPEVIFTSFGVNTIYVSDAVWFQK